MSQAELEYLQNKRETLYLQHDSLDNMTTKMEIEVITEKIWKVKKKIAQLQDYLRRRII